LSTEIDGEFRSRALAKYESGRRSTALFRALIVALATGTLSVLVRGPKSLVFLPLVFLAVAVGEWRGKLFGQGLRRGTVLGLASWLVPMAVLRPCCATMDAGATAGPCCTMPGCCLAAGACLGFVLVLFSPRGRKRLDDMSGAVGFAMGALGVTALRCSALFAGEAFGLLGGIALGALVVSFGRAVLSGSHSPA
jgi:hypothetical protein